MTEAKPNSSTTLDVFASIARRYDLANRVTSLGLDQSWRRVAARALALPAKGSVLDLASGTGDLAIADVRDGGAESVTATDVSEEMMAYGRAKVERLGLSDRIRFSHADAQELPYADGSFDGATVGFGVRNFADRPAAFGEVRRVLKPGARFVCLEFSRPASGLVRGPYLLYLRHVVPLLGGLLTKDRPSYEYLAASIEAFPDKETLAAMLTQAGFAAVTHRDLLFGGVAVHTATA